MDNIFDPRKKEKRVIIEETQLFTFRIRVSQYEALRRLSAKQNKTMGYIVDQALLKQVGE